MISSKGRIFSIREYFSIIYHFKTFTLINRLILELEPNWSYFLLQSKKNHRKQIPHSIQFNWLIDGREVASAKGTRKRSSITVDESLRSGSRMRWNTCGWRHHHQRHLKGFCSVSGQRGKPHEQQMAPISCPILRFPPLNTSIIIITMVGGRELLMDKLPPMGQFPFNLRADVCVLQTNATGILGLPSNKTGGLGTSAIERKEWWKGRRRRKNHLRCCWKQTSLPWEATFLLSSDKHPLPSRNKCHNFL